MLQVFSILRLTGVVLPVYVVGMPRKKPVRPNPLEDVRHEEVAQRLADGTTQLAAYTAVYRPDTDVSEYSAKERNTATSSASQLCRQTDIRERVRTLLEQRSAARLKVRIEDMKVSRGFITDRLIALVDRCMQAVPVLNRQGDAVGIYKFEPNGAVKALELLGIEQGMFERKHKHLHAKVNPLAGDRSEIVGRLGVLIEQLSDRDLAGIGLQRIGTVEVVAERVDDVGRQPVPALPAVSKAG